jgi:hypothetical protein
LYEEERIKSEKMKKNENKMQYISTNLSKEKEQIIKIITSLEKKITHQQLAKITHIH